MTKPLVLTCGDPAGIGPEIATKAWAALREHIPMVWIGDPRHLPENVPFQELSDISDFSVARHDALAVLPQTFAEPATPGTASLANAQGVIDVIKRAVSLVEKGHASAICTAPIHKKVLMDGANFAFPGHTEFLAHLAGVSDVVMMLASEKLRVVPTTIHIALADVPKVLTPDLLKRVIEITHAGLRDLFGIAEPRLSISGLNPHAGEGGAMGHEELDWMTALVQDLAASGMRISGPASADTMFHANARATYDAAIAMYHDQALIPIKTLDFDKGVNVTLGLPFVRTSPDHGTAFDIAGTGQANPSSMIEAIRMAHQMAMARAT